LAHVRRGDLLWSLVAASVRAVFWFHPLAWLGQRQLILTQEIAADELAIAAQEQNSVGYAVPTRCSLRCR
jgi:beta-lactamase regulating signal transducer with metallopeptidase domain